MPAVAQEVNRSSRSVIKLSLGVSLALFVAVVAAVMLSDASAEASTYSVTTSGGTSNWTAPTPIPWSCTPGAPGSLTCTGNPYPGSGGVDGDIANVNGFGGGLIVNSAIANAVTLNINNSSTVTVNSGGTLILTGSSVVANSTGTLTISGGTLTNNGSLTVQNNVSVGPTGTINFTGGTFSGTGTTTIQGGPGTPATMSITGANLPMFLVGQTIANNGTITYSAPTANPLSMNAGAIINNSAAFNLATNVLNVTNDAPINSDGTSKIAILSGGTLAKTAGTFNSINTDVDNGGTVNIQTGAIALTGGGTHTGAFTFTSTLSEIQFNGTHTFNNPWSWGGGIFRLKGGTSTLNSTATAISASYLEHEGGTLNGTSSIKVTTQFIWTGGTESGGATTEVLTGATSNINGTTVTLDTGRVLLLDSGAVLNYSPTVGNVLAINNGAKISNVGGTINLAGDNDITTNNAVTSTITNSAFGLVKKTGGVLTTIQPGFISAGGNTVSVQSGRLVLTGGGTISNSTLDISTIGTSLEFGGAGVFNVDPQTTTVSGTTSGSLRLTGNAMLKLTPTGVAWPINVTFLQDNASVLQSPGGISLNGIYNFNGGTMDGSGAGFRALNVNAGGVLNITGGNPTAITNSWVIQNNGGTINYNPTAAALAINSNASLQNSSGNFNIQNANGIGITSDGTGTITNLAAITKSAGGTTQIDANVSMSGGTIAVTAGNLVFNGPGVSQGISSNITASAGTTVEFRNGSIGWSGVFGGPGTYLISTGTVVFGGSFTAPPVVTQTGGDLTAASGSFTVGPGSVYNWLGGTIGGPTAGASLTINGGALNINTATSSVTLDNFTMNVGLGLTSTATWTGGNPITLQNNAPIGMSTGGTFDIQASSTVNLGACSGCNAGFFVNGGSTLQKSTSASTVVLNVPATNNGGTLSILTGALGLNSPNIINHTGTFNIASGAFLAFSNGTNQILSPASFTGAGTVKINGGTLTISPAVSIANIDLVSGTLSGNSISTTTSFLWSGGSLGGGGINIATGTLTMNGSAGPMDLSAFLSITSGATATYNAPTNRLNLNYPGASIINSGTFTLASTVPITLVGAPPAGTYLFTNNSGATLNGNGTINVPVTNDGNLNPGTSPGSITINNAYTQTANGVYNVDLNGTTPATQYDQLNVNGAVTLGGTLNATLGYTPANGDTYNVLTFTSRTGDFATKNLPTFGSGGTIQANYVAGPPPALQLVAAGPSADIAVTQSASPASINQGQSTTFAVVITNNGPSVASGITISDTFTGGTFVSVTTTAGASCSGSGPISCTIASLNVGASETISVTIKGTTAGTITNTASAALSNDSVPGNNTASTTVTVKNACPTTAPSNASPSDGTTNAPLNGTLSWSDVGASSYTVYLDVQGATACSKFFASTSATSIPYFGLQPGTTYQWRVETGSGCPIKTTACMTFTTTSTCPTTPPVPIAPVNTTAINSATFTWSGVPGARDYLLFVNGQQIADVTSTSFGPTPVPNGPTNWYVVAEFDRPCNSLQSATATFNGCNPAAITIPSVVAEADSGQAYDLTWDAVVGASRYEVDEATDLLFTNKTTQSTTNTKLRFQHPVTTPTAFYYRVRPFIDCANGFGANSVVVRVVLSPVTNPTNPNVGAPAGSTTLVPIIVHIPGFPDGSFPFTATLDPKNPFLKSVTPSSGLLPPAGIDLTVLADPTGLAAGTHTGTVLLSVTTSSSKGNIAPNGVVPVGAPVSVSLVTPVTPKPSGTPAANSLIIPSTGHLDGLNSRWASDVRILNTSAQSVHYQLTFTPDDTTQTQKQTVVQIDPNSTTALDDIVKTWYGVGSLGESSNGSLEIRPLDNPAKTGADDASVSFVTVATSRTYNTASSASTASYGEFIPAIPFGNFVGRALDSAHLSTVLGMQQIAQSDTMRTNLGVMEASGQPASILISVFNATGQKLLDVPMSLAGGQHVQLNGFLSQNKISLPDGRIEVQVTSGEGKIMAYASVIDNKSGDPILVSGTPLRQNSFDTFVLPGVADLNTPLAAWRTDMRIFNPTTTPQTTTLTFYPLAGQGSTQTTSMTVNAGEVKSLDNTLSSVFGVTNAGGTIHVTTAAPEPLVVTGRTYNVTTNGTFGQLANAVTSADAIGQGDRPLQILQAEDSVRQRTNLGLFEVTGKPATVQVTLILPDSKISPSTQIPLPANGFVQIPVISSFGFSNVYNARISMSVVSGAGKISAYGSVIDQVTQDPTYVPAQH